MARVAHIAVLSLNLLLAACATAPGSRPQPGIRAEPERGTSIPAARLTTDPRALLVAGATAMRGQPYRWGGDAPGGFDCSGLVFYAAARRGIVLPRTAREQLRSGTAVSRRDVRAGDLVFMHLTHKELHVGIAIDNDTFVHAPATGGQVRIDSLRARPYAGGFLAARRIVGDGTSGAASTIR